MENDYYSKLGENFLNWVENINSDIEKHYESSCVDEDIYERYDINDNEITNAINATLRRYDFEQLQIICHLLSNELTYHFEVTEGAELDKKVLSLIVFQIGKLRIFDSANDNSFYENYLSNYAQAPNKECWYCGKKLPEDLHGKVKFCHFTKSYNKEKCPTGESNPKKHPRGCCFRNWKFSQKSLRDKFKTILNSKKYKTLDEKVEEATEVLLDFCDLKYFRLLTKMKNSNYGDYNFDQY